jgi:hypothetical protein
MTQNDRWPGVATAYTPLFVEVSVINMVTNFRTTTVISSETKVISGSSSIFASAPPLENDDDGKGCYPLVDAVDNRSWIH